MLSLNGSKLFCTLTSLQEFYFIMAFICAWAFEGYLLNIHIISVLKQDAVIRTNWILLIVGYWEVKSNIKKNMHYNK